ncbi:MAG: hypothetical protein C0501_17185 [Isosphaera sp.]|nr:hypothetical protein [Isosphaera sp.]
MSDSATRLAAPPRVPGLELLDKIGEGGTGVVYRAVHRNLQREVAVKVLRADGAPGWLRESRLTAALAHPNVVGIHDAGATDGNHYLVLEYLTGGSLRTRMAPGRAWAPADAIGLVETVAGALEHIHGRGVLHLDLKPENILFAADGGVKVSDFGLAVAEEDAGDLLGGREYPGTVDYAAPERRAGLTPDARYDVFSLATLAYELLTGRLPGRVFVPATARNPQLPPAVDPVLRRGLAREPDDRYGSVAEFRDALAAACGPARPRPRRRWLAAAAVGAVGAAAAAVAAYHWPPADPGPLPPAAPAVAAPDRAWVFYDRPEELALFAGDLGGLPVERVFGGPKPGKPPAELQIPSWPAPGSVLAVRSPDAWVFVNPLTDPGLADRVVRNWPAVVGAAVPPGKNLVKAGGFDGDCLRPGTATDLWRLADTGWWTPDRRIDAADPPDRPGNPALRLTFRDPPKDKGRRQINCYQPIAAEPPAGAVLVLRFRARAGAGAGAANLTVSASLPVTVRPDDIGPAAARVRATATQPKTPAGEPVDPSLWVVQGQRWFTPGPEWRTYAVVTETPPFPTRGPDRKVSVGAAAGEVWVDDVELFAWQPGGAP